jgi:hypothetical protein
MIEIIIHKSHGAGIGGVSSLVHKIVKLLIKIKSKDWLQFGHGDASQGITNNGSQICEMADLELQPVDLQQR